MSEQELKLYKIRWFVAVLMMLYQILVMSNTSYGVVNDVYVDYFGITYAQVDFMSTTGYIVALPLTALLALLHCVLKVRLRKLMLLATGCLTIEYLLLAVAFRSPLLYGLCIAGKGFSGIAAVAGKAVPSTFAVLWFPDHQVGTVLGMIMFGNAFGEIFSALVMGYVVNPEYTTSMSTLNASFHNATGDGHFITPQALANSTKAIFIYLTAVTIVTFCVLVAFYVVLADQPPTPPTHAQTLKRMSENKPEATESFCTSVKAFLKQTKQLWTNRTYVLMVVSWIIFYQTVRIELTFMGEIVRDGNFSDPYGKSSNIIIAYFTGCLVGAAFGGKVVDKFKNYIWILRIGCLLAVLSTALVATGIATRIYWLVMASNALFGAAAQTCVIALMEIVTQNTYPMDEGFVNMWKVFLDGVYAILIVVVGRIFYEHLGGFAVLMFQCSTMLVATAVAWTSNIELKRIEAEKEESYKLLK